MSIKKFLLFLTCILFSLHGISQVPISEKQVDISSLSYYNSGQWKELLSYGKEQITQSVDFPLLRMRIGYAAFRLHNFSESLIHYEQVLQNDPTNQIAIYYAYLNNVYLGNITTARFYAAQLSIETKNAEKLKKFNIAELQTEYSYKIPDASFRANAQYSRIGLILHLGFKTTLEQSYANYSQTIAEPQFTSIINNNNIVIKQQEYYGKLKTALSNNVTALGGVHYIYNRFNNLIYQNYVAFVGIQHTIPYTKFQANFFIGNIGDSSYKQVDLLITLLPKGNTNVYLISKISYIDKLLYSQIIGFKLLKNIWLEGNVTIGQFTKVLENDGLYLYNDVDVKKLKAGSSLYFGLSKKLQFNLNYTFERKQRIFSNKTIFNQNSINGGISWKF